MDIFAFYKIKKVFYKYNITGFPWKNIFLAKGINVSNNQKHFSHITKKFNIYRYAIKQEIFHTMSLGIVFSFEAIKEVWYNKNLLMKFSCVIHYRKICKN